MFKQKLPTHKNIADISNINTGTFSGKRSLKPDVVILADWQYKAIRHPPAARIKAASIPSSWSISTPKPSRSTRDAEIFPVNSTVRERQKLRRRIRQALPTSRSVARAKQSKPENLYRVRRRGPSEYSYTFGKDMWGAIADTAGGNNIAAPYVKNWGPVNPEKFLTAKPDVIVISGTENGP